MSDRLQIFTGDCREILRSLDAESVQCCVTSPPYWGLRDYGMPEQIGLETTPEEYVEKMVEVFREVRRVLRDDGTLWLNLGDSYAGSWGNQGRKPERGTQRPINGEMLTPVHDGRYPSKERNTGACPPGLKSKDLVGIPWRVAFALQADGWWLRQDIIWSKPNPMPESVRDRCTKAHEYLFLLSKSEHYYYDNEAIREPLCEASIERLSQDVNSQQGSDRVPGKTNGRMKAVGRLGNNANSSLAMSEKTRAGTAVNGNRNKRSVWTVTTQPYADAHFATFPPALIRPCVLAGSRPGDLVLDPFGGSGTTGQVALEYGRHAVLCELNPEYIELARRRTAVTPGLPLTQEARPVE